MNQTIQYRTAEQVSSDNIGMFFCTFSSKKYVLASEDNDVLKAVLNDSARCSSSGKEKDSETGYYYFGARYYNPDLSLWLSVDPMADKYPSLSPYNYCAWNPVKLVDPDGRDVLPTSIEALNMIRNSVPEEAREYIQTDERGVINQDLINSYDCSSSNFNDLKELVNSGCTIEVSLDDEFNYISQDNSIRTEHMPYYSDGGSLGGYFDLSTGESGWYGQTQYPDNNAAYPSINDNVRITINKNLSSSGRTESFAHEFYGHAYIYANTGNASAASHGYGQQNTSETNLSLKNRIINAMSEVRKYATR